MARRLVALALAVLLADSAAAFRLSQDFPLFLRLEGRVGPPQPATLGAADWEMVVNDQTIRFQLTHLIVMGGQASEGDVVNALAPYRPQVRLYGPKEMLAAIAGAKPADSVAMLAYLVGTPGTAQLMVSQATVTPPVPPVTLPTS